ncbi:type 2 isopentenyl-diphosphate Delta-isomerase [Apilactobacillus ozensis]|uniref:Isopentenyl-diphosphate delta-isomerase n=1 Tax=Apilactobacillus ozensis DSM 23829 = JCM 17196 TaxID=1423781 RepID=A0A0R2AME7_9LACO|nr:type 2 isopentenyl-diphosphate Delta-isomerase [Apilactobacillus ozensis]KRM68032.1 isopentenyl pyrophosphate isomerase [Apilactobacillus ozensis DSM 23829 = JCM 17196]MCK8606537.1 type 2 isopentenyl-diphosphate Delta-isomerase [Apilactobacillus ozensis]
MNSQHAQRKNEHISLAEKFHKENSMADFDKIRFIHQSLPEISVKDVSMQTKLGNISLPCPFYIEAMTGGSKLAGELNEKLARIANKCNLAIASGSESIAIKDASTVQSFANLRKFNPNGIIIANMGASHSVNNAKKAIEIINADAIEIHVNTVQEIVMPEGNRNFKWLDNIKNIVEAVNIPVIVKEVGFGMDKSTIQQLKNIGVEYINISGRGGTNFVQIENFRREHKELNYLDSWGQSTVESLLEAYQYRNDLNIIASGGIKNALDIVKCIALGAKAVGVAGPILHSVLKNGETDTIEMIQEWQQGIVKIMTILGCTSLSDLRNKKLILSTDMLNYIHQRNIEY